MSLASLASVTVDPKIYSRVNLIRLPNSIHGKTGFRAVPLTLSECESLDGAELHELASSPRSADWAWPVNDLDNALGRGLAEVLASTEKLDFPSRMCEQGARTTRIVEPEGFIFTNLLKQVFATSSLGPEGGRNSVLFRCAGTLAEVCDEAAVTALLWSIAIKSGLERSEIRSTINSAVNGTLRKRNSDGQENS